MDQPLITILSPEAQERIIAAEEAKAQALMIIAGHLPALIEALKTSRSYGGGKKKDKDAVGFYPYIPTLELFQKNDTIHVPATCFSASNGRVTFYSPFNIEGMIAMKQNESDGQWYRYPGAKLSSIKIDSDLFKRIFGDWKPTEDGQPKWFKDGAIKILTVSIGVDKDDPNKRFSFIVGKKDADTNDPLALQFDKIPQPPTFQPAAPQNGHS